MASDGLGLTAEEMQAVVGGKIDPKVLFIVTPDAIYWKSSGRWHKSEGAT